MKNEKIFSIVKSIGFELEGGCDYKDSVIYAKLNEFDFVNDVNIGRDMSVFVEDKYYTNIEIKFWIYTIDFDKLYYVFKTLYNQLGFRQNNTCGNHLHIKLANYEDYYKLFNIKTILLFRKEYLDFAKRIEDKYKIKNAYEKYKNRFYNKYCKGISSKEDLLRNFIRSRYYMINFDSFCKHRLNTLEFRIMPYAEKIIEHLLQAKFILNFVANVVLEKNDIYAKKGYNITNDIENLDSKIVKTFEINDLEEIKKELKVM